MKDVDLAFGVGGDSGDAAELPAVRHGVGLFTEPDRDPILKQGALVGIPAFRHITLTWSFRFRLLRLAQAQD
jgi:hypothetical protein